MARNSWHILREAGAVTLARHLPPRFDIVESMQLAAGPNISQAALAHQVRQDVWRALQHVRGFSPVVKISRTKDDIAITAGGRLSDPQNKGGAEAALMKVLGSPANHRRWLAHAGRKK